jgi:hypothetical protein
MGVVGMPWYHIMMKVEARPLIEDVDARIDGIGR